MTQKNFPQKLINLIRVLINVFLMVVVEHARIRRVIDVVIHVVVVALVMQELSHLLFRWNKLAIAQGRAFVQAVVQGQLVKVGLTFGDHGRLEVVFRVVVRVHGPDALHFGQSLELLLVIRVATVAQDFDFWLSLLNLALAVFANARFVLSELTGAIRSRALGLAVDRAIWTNAWAIWSHASVRGRTVRTYAHWLRT